MLFTIFTLLISRRNNNQSGSGEGGENELNSETRGAETLARIRDPVTYYFDSQSDLNEARSDYYNSGRTPEYHPDHHLIDYVNFPARATQFNFTTCQMSNCFDFSRCRFEGPIKIHIKPSLSIKSSYEKRDLGENNIIHQSLINIVRTSTHHEPNESQACLVLLEDDTLDRDPLSQSFRPDLTGIFGPEQRFGLNYLVFNLFSGTWPNYAANDFGGIQIGAAILAKASSSQTHHRANFDISIPLFSSSYPVKDLNNGNQNYSTTDKRYFLTFKGKRYVIGSGSETRNSLYHIDNGRDTIMLSTCRHGKKWQEVADTQCTIDSANYDKYDFIDLMKRSTFCLVPRGRRLGSFRFLEALSFGCIPVILSDGWVLPFNEIIDWSKASVRFNESSLLIVADMLRDISDETIGRLRANGQALYNRYLSSLERIVMTTIEILDQRMRKFAFQHYNQVTNPNHRPGLALQV